MVKAIDSLGDETFFETLSSSFQDVVYLDKGNLILAYLRHNRPGILARRLSGKDLKLHLDNYLPPGSMPLPLFCR